MRSAVAAPVLLFTALFAVAVPDGMADPFMQDESGWLQTMAFAAHQTNYSGTFMYQYGNHIEVSRITHIVDGEGEHGRLESLDGKRREVIRHNDQVWCYVGDRKLKLGQRQAGREFPALLPEQLSLLNENYVFKVGEEGRVAGFHAHAMIFEPKDKLRYMHKMWADSESGLLLKAEVVGERGELIEQYAFTQLALKGNIDTSWMDEERPDVIPVSQHHASLPKAEPLHKASGWQVDAMPAGFKKITEIRRLLPNKKAPAIQMVFSDGLAGISIFIENLSDNADVNPGLSSQGIIQIYSRAIDDEHLVTVVGEVPPETVMQVADSVRYTGE